MLIYAGVMQVLKLLYRQCPKCGHRQVVPSKFVGRPVSCNICRHEIKSPR